jgi:hypothetical protein
MTFWTFRNLLLVHSVSYCGQLLNIAFLALIAINSFALLTQLAGDR